MVRAFSIKVEAIHAEHNRVGSQLSEVDVSRVLELDEIELPGLGPRDVHLRILACSVEHNVSHAALADTINIAELRGGKIYPGNSALAEVVEVGTGTDRFQPGDIVITHCNGRIDRYGYPERIWAYDQPDSTGWYAQEAVVGDWQIMLAPLDCGLNLWELAALPLRAPTAYHLWRRASGMFRLKVSEEQLAQLNVLGFGGGVSELFLMLARSRGHRAFFCAGSPERRDALARLGIETIDQNLFNRFATKSDVRAFCKEVKRRTGGTGMHIVCDMLRGPVFQAGIAACARQGVNVSAGWQLGKVNEYDSAGAAVKQITLDHVHYETPLGCATALELYGRVFKPTVHTEIYGFEDLPRALAEMHWNMQTGIPVVCMTDDMPAAVQHLIS